MAMASPVLLVDPDPRWPELFRAEKRRIERALVPYVLSVEHTGSTAVPGLPAKPTVDILLGLYRLSDAPRVVARMQKLGYAYLPEYEDELPERRLFCTPADRSVPPAFNVHAVEVASPLYERHIRFRNWLRAHPEDRDAYARLKRELAAAHADDRGAYTGAKTPFIRAVEEKALEAERDRKNAPAEPDRADA